MSRMLDARARSTDIRCRHASPSCENPPKIAKCASSWGFVPFASATPQICAFLWIMCFSVESVLFRGGVPFSSATPKMCAFCGGRTKAHVGEEKHTTVDSLFVHTGVDDLAARKFVVWRHACCSPLSMSIPVIRKAGAPAVGAWFVLEIIIR